MLVPSFWCSRSSSTSPDPSHSPLWPSGPISRCSTFISTRLFSLVLGRVLSYPVPSATFRRTPSTSTSLLTSCSPIWPPGPVTRLGEFVGRPSRLFHCLDYLACSELEKHFGMPVMCHARSRCHHSLTRLHVPSHPPRVTHAACLPCLCSSSLHQNMSGSHLRSKPSSTLSRGVIMYVQIP